MFFKVAQKVTKYFGYFSKKNLCRELSKLSNLVTLATFNEKGNLDSGQDYNKSFYAPTPINL